MSNGKRSFVVQQRNLLSLSDQKFTFQQPPLIPQKETLLGTAASAVPADQLPNSLADLSETNVRSYELTVTAATSLNIPVVGSVGGGYNRRVIVLEQYAVKKIIWQDTRYDYGYAIRFCLTVNNWNANLKVSLPFLAASAEIGTISAQWLLQVIGLSGNKINAAIPPPTELNVEQFVIVKQKLVELVDAMQDSTTRFTPVLIHKLDPKETLLNHYRIAAAQAYALTSIGSNRSLSEALGKFKGVTEEEDIVRDSIRGVYKDFAGLEMDETAKPSPAAASRAREILGKITAGAK